MVYYLTEEKRYDMIFAFSSTSRYMYLDDLLNIDNIHFEQMVTEHIPLNFNLTKLMLLIPKQPFRFKLIYSTKMYDKRDEFDFDILMLLSLMAMSPGVPLMVCA